MTLQVGRSNSRTSTSSSLSPEPSQSSSQEGPTSPPQHPSPLFATFCREWRCTSRRPSLGHPSHPPPPPRRWVKTEQHLLTLIYFVDHVSNHEDRSILECEATSSTLKHQPPPPREPQTEKNPKPLKRKKKKTKPLTLNNKPQTPNPKPRVKP